MNLFHMAFYFFIAFLVLLIASNKVKDKSKRTNLEVGALLSMVVCGLFLLGSLCKLLWTSMP